MQDRQDAAKDTAQDVVQDVVQAKRALRRGLLAVRRALPRDVVAAASERIVRALRTLPELAGKRAVLLYAADPDEVDLDALIASAPDGCRVLLPRVEDGEVVAVRHAPDAPLAVGHRGIREPVGAPVDLATVDAVVVPGVAFGPTGERLGRGAGMYDRLLPRLTGAVRVGVCLERFVRDDLPVEPHDVHVDVVVTDASVRRRPHAEDARPA
jgi:5-formyltetrahydrofolate cyclo-ligase